MLPPPTHNPAIQGNPRDYSASLAAGATARQLLNNAKHSGGSNPITVPVLRTPYASLSTDSQGLTATQVKNAEIANQAAANATGDAGAFKKGGASRKKRTCKRRRRGRKSKVCKRKRRTCKRK